MIYIEKKIVKRDKESYKKKKKRKRKDRIIREND